MRWLPLTLAALLAGCTPRDPPPSRLEAQTAPTARVAPRPAPTLPAPLPAQPRVPAPIPPGAPPDWLAKIRSGRGRLQAFPPFEITFDYDDGLDVGRARRHVTVGRLRIDTLDETVRPGYLYVTGWCHTRQAVRIFRADQMADLRDPATGAAPADIRAWLLEQTRHD